MTAKLFFNELGKILSSHPNVPAKVINSEDSESGDYLFYCKNMHVAFDDAHCSDCIYSYDGYIVKNCVDTDYCTETELAYENVDSFKCFNSDYLEYCTSVTDSSYSAYCINCHDVFGCVNLTNKSYCIFNRQLSEKEYKQKIAEYKKWPAERVLEMVEELKKRYPFTPKEGHNENSLYGNYIHYNKDCYMCFDAAHNESSAYLYDSHYNTTCYDMTYAAQNNQLSYEVVDSANLFNCNFAVYSANSNDSSYIFNCSNLKNCIGCVSLTNKEYCILNRQLTKEKYEKVSKKLLEELKNKNFGWGDLRFK